MRIRGARFECVRRAGGKRTDGWHGAFTYSSPGHSVSIIMIYRRKNGANTPSSARPHARVFFNVILCVLVTTITMYLFNFTAYANTFLIRSGGRRAGAVRIFRRADDGRLSFKRVRAFPDRRRWRKKVRPSVWRRDRPPEGRRFSRRGFRTISLSTVGHGGILGVSNAKTDEVRQMN